MSPHRKQTDLSPVWVWWKNHFLVSSQSEAPPRCLKKGRADTRTGREPELSLCLWQNETQAAFLCSNPVQVQESSNWAPPELSLSSVFDVRASAHINVVGLGSDSEFVPPRHTVVVSQLGSCTYWPHVAVRVNCRSSCCHISSLPHMLKATCQKDRSSQRDLTQPQRHFWIFVWSSLRS